MSVAVVLPRTETEVSHVRVACIHLPLKTDSEWLRHCLSYLNVVADAKGSIGCNNVLHNKFSLSFVSDFGGNYSISFLYGGCDLNIV